MATTDVREQFGTVIEWDVAGGTTFLPLAEARVIAIPGTVSATFDRSSHDTLVDASGFMESGASGLKTHETLTYNFNFDETNAEHTALEAAVGALVNPNFRITFLGGTIKIFRAVVVSFKHDDHVWDAVAAQMFTLILQPSGAIT